MRQSEVVRLMSLFCQKITERIGSWLRELPAGNAPVGLQAPKSRSFGVAVTYCCRDKSIVLCGYKYIVRSKSLTPLNI
jgi:hypothetical protein